MVIPSTGSPTVAVSAGDDIRGSRPAAVSDHDLYEPAAVFGKGQVSRSPAGQRFIAVVGRHAPCG
jgi:hypothetical protein